MNVPSYVSGHSRRASRSESTTSSVVTVRKSGPPVRSAPRTSYMQARPPSSESIGKHFNTLDVAAEEAIPDPPDVPNAQRPSPNLNINRWSHSTSSSLSGIEAELMKPITFSPPTGIAQTTRPEQLSNSLIARPQYSAGVSVAVSQPRSHMSPRRSPRRTSRSSRPPSSNAANRFFFGTQDSASSPSHDLTPDLSFEGSRPTSRQDYFAGTWEQSKLQSKFGQPVEGIALHYQPGSHGPRKTSGSGFGDSLHQATNSSHIGLQKRPVHPRQRDRSANGSRDTAAGGSISSVQSDHRRTRSHRSPTQKTMLSQALTRANDAVQLDNKQDFQGAIHAYNEACDILEQVMRRSNDPDDRSKLSNIRSTYSTRIAELYDLDNSFAHLMDKELPAAPPVEHYVDEPDVDQYSGESDTGPRILLDSLPPRQESLLPQIFGGDNFIEQNPAPKNRSPTTTNLNVPMDAAYMPSPLSPRRPPSPQNPSEEATPVAITNPANAFRDGEELAQSSGPTSWLDTMEESASSPPSSRLSSIDFGATDHQLASQIEAEFDAAMNAAVDAAYEDEDPTSEATPRPSDRGFDVDMASGLPSFDLHSDKHVLQSQASLDTLESSARFDHLTREYLDVDGDGEEAMLEMMVKAGFLEDSVDEQHVQAPLPRQSDSSSFSARSSGRTWDGSVASTTATNHTTLSTLAESPEIPQNYTDKLVEAEDEDYDDSSAPTPVPLSEAEMLAQKQALAEKQDTPLPSIPPSEKPVGLRDRRFSVQSTKRLKIETFARRASVSRQGPSQILQMQAPPILDEPPTQMLPEIPLSASNSNPSGLNLPFSQLPSANLADSLPSASPDTPALTHDSLQPSIEENAQALPSPGLLAKMMPPPMRKNTSATSPRKRNLSLATSTSDIDKEPPPTPGSAAFPPAERRNTNTSGNTPVLPTPSPSVANSSGVGGMYLFENVGDISWPQSPQSFDVSGDPMPLEPCPEMFLLRPFWIMRCLYQTLAHPRGGYLTSRLFVPRDIWRVKNVKIKVMEEKIAQCDMLTAALLKLGKVDTFDADAVWEELQTFESILETARIALQKKLGNEVGFTGSANLFKSPTNEEPDPLSQKSNNSAAKSIASGWRKLRSKSSNVVLSSSTSNGLGKDKDKDALLTMTSLPMTRNSDVTTSRSYRGHRYPPPTPTSMQYVLPLHSNYMSSLARLCDAAQVLDSIARQVVDPGLKATSETHVGLEISMRNVAEFFAFFVIRFALQDIGLLMDKYLKRGTEWVMS